MTVTGVYSASAVNGRRYRRTNAELAEIDAALYDIAEAEKPVTIRGLFYRMVSAGLVPKTDKGHNNGYGVVQRQMLKMRRNGSLPHGWVADGTRLRLKPSTWPGADSMLYYTAQTYRRSLWDEQDHHVEIWSEKDAIRGVVYVTAEYDVPLLIARGYSSETFLHETAADIAEDGKDAVIYQLGDHDRDGVNAWKAIQRRLREFVPGSIELTFERTAVTPAQIALYKLPTRPDKTDSGFGPCVEVDAIASSTLRDLVRDAIEQWIDPEALWLTRIAEESEREILTRIAGGWEDLRDSGEYVG